MAIGEVDDPIAILDRPTGIVGTIWFDAAAIIGGALGALSAAAIALKQGIAAHALHSLPNTLIPPGQAAVLAVKDPTALGAYADEARYSGVDGPRFEAMRLLAEQSPGADTILTLWRLGRIDDGQMTLGLRQQQFPDIWIDAIRALKFQPISPGQYLQGAVQGHYGHDEAIHQATLQGITAEDAEVIYQTLGDPPGTMQMLELWNRGKMTEAEVDLGLSESRLKLKYVDLVKQLAVYIPPVRTVTALLRSGALPESRARELYRFNGVSDVDADAYVADALHGKVASHKQVSVSTVKSLFVDHLITREQAEAWLEKIGYTPDDSDTLLTLATFEAEQKLHSQTITKIRTLFVGKHIDEATARADLAHLNVDMTQTADLLDLWKLEQQVPSKELTLAQLTNMAKANVIDQPTWMLRVQALGYSPADAALLAALDFPPTTP